MSSLQTILCWILTFLYGSGSSLESAAAPKTKMTMHGIPINATAEERKTFKDGHSSMQQGFKGTLDQLDAYLASVKKESKR